MINTRVSYAVPASQYCRTPRGHVGLQVPRLGVLQLPELGYVVKDRDGAFVANCDAENPAGDINEDTDKQEQRAVALGGTCRPELL